MLIKVSFFRARLYPDSAPDHNQFQDDKYGDVNVLSPRIFTKKAFDLHPGS